MVLFLLLVPSLWAHEETQKPESGAMKILGPGEVSFKNDVQPILHDYCVGCHSVGGKGYIKSGLDLTSYEDLRREQNTAPSSFPATAKPAHSPNCLPAQTRG